VAQVGGKLGEERPVDRDRQLPSALPITRSQPPSLVDVGEQQPADLGRTESAQQHGEHHRSVPVGSQPGQKGLDVGQVE